MTLSPPSQRLLLGITGGIAAYKCAELVRLLVQDQWDVQVVMTDAAKQFITPVTMQALSGKPVISQMWAGDPGGGMDHIDLSRTRDLILVAPATADFLSKLAHGAADDLLSTLCLARDCPLMVAPAMNRQMWANSATVRNVAQLETDGVWIAGPGAGAQACGEVGMGRMLEPEQLLQAVRRAITPQLLKGKRVLITAGPTFESIDPVRGITNRSSGKMGYGLAQAAYECGAEVIVISGPATAPVPYGIELISVTTAAQMHAAVAARVANTDAFMAVAAVADYRVAQANASKIKKSEASLVLTLEPNPDILSSVSTSPHPPFCVGFAAESEDLDRHAQDKRRRKRLPLLVGNIAQDAIGADQSVVVLYDDEGRHALPVAPKIEHARHIVRHMARLMKNERSRK